MRCILTNKTIGITLFSIGTNDSYHWNQWTPFPLMRCILTNRTIGMTPFSIGTNCTIGTNEPSELPCTQTGHTRKGPLNEMHINQ